MYTRTATGRHPLILAAIALLLLAGTADAGRLRYLVRDERLCASPPDLCLDVSLSYQSNVREFHLSGRVHSGPGPGLLVIRVRGTNRLGEAHYAPLEKYLAGRPGEIVDFSMRPDYPDISNWELDAIEFRAGAPDPKKRRP